MTFFACAGCVARESLVIVPSTMTASAAPANLMQGQTAVLVENATLLARVKFRSVGRWAIVVDAEGREGANGAWPRFRLTVGDVSSGTITVARENRGRYWMSFLTEPGFSDIRLSFFNGGTGESGPSVVITSLELVPL